MTSNPPEQGTKRRGHGPQECQPHASCRCLRFPSPHEGRDGRGAEVDGLGGPSSSPVLSRAHREGELKTVGTRAQDSDSSRCLPGEGKCRISTALLYEQEAALLKLMGPGMSAGRWQPAVKGCLSLQPLSSVSLPIMLLPSPLSPSLLPCVHCPELAQGTRMTRSHLQEPAKDYALSPDLL